MLTKYILRLLSCRRVRECDMIDQNLAKENAQSI